MLTESITQWNLSITATIRTLIDKIYDPLIEDSKVSIYSLLMSGILSL